MLIKLLLLYKVGMATITKKDLIDRIADIRGLTRTDVRAVLQTFLDEIILELGNGNRLEFRDFGVFESKMRESRWAQNPKTMDKVEVPRARTVRFKMGRVMRRRLIDAPPNIDAATGLPIEPSARTNKNSRRSRGG